MSGTSDTDARYMALQGAGCPGSARFGVFPDHRYSSVLRDPGSASTSENLIALYCQVWAMLDDGSSAPEAAAKCFLGKLQFDRNRQRRAARMGLASRPGRYTTNCAPHRAVRRRRWHRYGLPYRTLAVERVHSLLAGSSALHCLVGFQGNKGYAQKSVSGKLDLRGHANLGVRDVNQSCKVT